MFEISVKGSFSAAHHLREYKGQCEDPHGHNWDVEVIVSGQELDGTGLLIDFKKLKASLKDIMDVLDHKDLNELKEFEVLNPTSENIAKYIHEQLSDMLASDRYAISEVAVCETVGSKAIYRAD